MSVIGASPSTVVTLKEPQHGTVILLPPPPPFLFPPENTTRPAAEEIAGVAAILKEDRRFLK